MPAPTTYDEAALKQFMADELGATGVALSLTTSSAQLTQAVYAVQRLLGLDNVADATDMPLLEAAARWKAWQAAEAAAVAQFDVKAGSADVKRSQLFDHLQRRLSRTESDWYTALATYQEAQGTAPSFFAFGTAAGCRGR